MKFKIHGWQRLWISIGILYFFIIGFLAWTIFPTQPPKEYPCNDPRNNLYGNPFCSLPKDEELILKKLRNEQITILEHAFLIWIIPLVLLYIIGLLIKWTYEGFK